MKTGVLIVNYCEKCGAKIHAVFSAEQAEKMKYASVKCSTCDPSSPWRQVKENK